MCLEYVPDLQVGEYTIVHVGFALQRLDEQSALETLELFRQMGELDAEFGDQWGRAAEQAGLPGPDGSGRHPTTDGANAVKYLDEFQDPELAKRLLDDIHATVTRPWAMMEVCGGQTHSIIRHGLDQLLPDEHRADPRAGLPGVRHPAGGRSTRRSRSPPDPRSIFCSFGDMLRVPGSDGTCSRSRAPAATSVSCTPRSTPSNLARQNPDRQVVFFGIGFETTAPPNAMTVYQAEKLGIENFSLLVSHVRVPPAIEAIMTSPECRVQAFLAAGHVCTVMGTGEYPALAERFRVPIVVTGFEPLDILEGIRRAVHQLEEGRHEVENAYPRAVSAGGQPGRACRCWRTSSRWSTGPGAASG